MRTTTHRNKVFFSFSLLVRSPPLFTRNAQEKRENKMESRRPSFLVPCRIGEPLLFPPKKSRQTECSSTLYLLYLVEEQSRRVILLTCTRVIPCQRGCLGLEDRERRQVESLLLLLRT